MIVDYNQQDHLTVDHFAEQPNWQVKIHLKNGCCVISAIMKAISNIVIRFVRTLREDFSKDKSSLKLRSI